MPDLDLSSPSLVHLSVMYGYPVLFVFVLIASAGLPLPVSFLLLGLGALSAAHSGPSFAFLAFIGILASLGGDLADYSVGRFAGPPFLHWLHSLRSLRSASLFDQAAERLRQRGSLMIVLSRFLFTPLAMPISILVGASSFTFVSFLLWDALGETIYVLSYLTLGRIFGNTLSSEGPLEFIFGSLGILIAIAPILYGSGRLHLPKRLHTSSSDHNSAHSISAGDGNAEDHPTAAVSPLL